MLKKYIPSLITVLFVVGCSSSHTDKIKKELGSDFNNKVYVALGGEADSKQRYLKYCELLKTKQASPVQLKVRLLSSSLNTQELQLANAEINLANKDCSK